MGEDWIECSLGNIGEIFSGGTPKTSIDKYWGDEISWISPADLSKYDDKYISKGKKSITKLGLENSSAKLIPAGSILFSSRAPIGYVVIAKNDLATNQGFKSIYPATVVFNEYIFYFLKASRNLAEKSASGTTFKEISKKAFSELPFPLPPLPIQRAIVAKIEGLFSDLDKGIADLKKAQAQLVVYRQAVLKKAFEGELTKEWREKQTNLPSAEELLEQIKEERERHYTQQLEDWKKAVKAWEGNGKKGKKPGKPKALKELPKLSIEELDLLPKIPKSWLWIKNGNLALKITDGEHITPKRSEKGYYLLSARNIQNGYLDYSIVDYVEKEEYNRIRKRCNPEFGDILISCSGSVGRVSHVPQQSDFVMVRSVALLKYSPEISYYLFQEYLFLSPDIQSQIEKGKKATAQANLFLGPIGNLSIIHCSIAEQHQIVQEIESRLSVCDKVEQSITESLEKAQALRQSILKKAFEGALLSEAEIAQCKKEKDYEPASVLLKKIRNEKLAKAVKSKTQKVDH